MREEWFVNPVNDRVRIQAIIAEVTAIAAQMLPGMDVKDQCELMRRLQQRMREFSAIIGEFYAAAQKMKKGIDNLAQTQDALREARDLITALNEEIDKLSSPPLTYGVYLSANSDGTLNILSQGRKVKVNLHPKLTPAMLTEGQEVILNEGLNVIEAASYETRGEVVAVKDILGEDRVLVTCRADEDRVCRRAGSLADIVLKIGDHLLMDSQAGYVYERLPKSEVEDLLLEEVPDIRYEDIGGLKKQIAALRDAVELPYLYPEYFKEYKLTPPKGVLLFGPPGCGKTLIAKAVANNLALQASKKRGEEVHGYFLNIKGPELLTKWVGETERKIREIFLKAKEKANEDFPVVIFFDEMDALFHTRGTGISSDVETTIVPQILAEIDGVEGLKNVIVIGASNRQDLIDPAILRPGRLDVKIKVERPDAPGAFDIIGKYSKPGIPLHPKFGPFPMRYETPNRLKELVPDEWEALDRSLSPILAVLGLQRSDLGRRKIPVDKDALEKAIAVIEAAYPPDARGSEAEEKAKIVFDLRREEWICEAWELRTEEDAFHYINYKAIESLFISTPRPLLWVASGGELVKVDTRFLEVTYANGDKEMLYRKDFISGAMLESIVRRAKKRALKRFIESGTKGIMMVDFWLATREENDENADLLNTAHPDDWAKIQGRRGERVVNVKPISSDKMYTASGAAQERRRGREVVVNTGQYL